MELQTLFVTLFGKNGILVMGVMIPIVTLLSATNNWLESADVSLWKYPLLWLKDLLISEIIMSPFCFGLNQRSPFVGVLCIAGSFYLAILTGKICNVISCWHDKRG